MSGQKYLERNELTFSVPWGHISAVGWGYPQDKPILLVHGTMDNADSFARLIQHLPVNYYYVAVDLPGHGKSSHYPQGMNLEFLNFVLAIRFVLDELKWEKCLYIGHSFGAQLGVMFSILQPNRIEQIIAIDAFMPKSFTNNELLGRIKHVNDTTIFTMKKKESTLYTREQIFDALYNRRNFKLNKEAAEAIFDRATTKIGNLYKFNRDPRMRSAVTGTFTLDQCLELTKHLQVPVLLIIAEQSWYDVVRERSNLEKYKLVLPETLTMIVVQGNHDVHNNEPEKVSPHISVFFNDSKSKL